MALTTQTEYAERLQVEAVRVWLRYVRGLPLYASLPKESSLALVRELYPEIGNTYNMSVLLSAKLNAAWVGDHFNPRTTNFLDEVAAIERQISYTNLRDARFDVLDDLADGPRLWLREVNNKWLNPHLLLKVLLGLLIIEENIVAGRVDPVAFGVVMNPATGLVLELLAGYLYGADAD